MVFLKETKAEVKSKIVMLRSWKVKTYWIQLTQALESLL